MLKLVHQIIIIFKSLNMYAVESFNLGKGTVERNKKSKTTIIFDSKNKKNKKTKILLYNDKGLFFYFILCCIHPWVPVNLWPPTV